MKRIACLLMTAILMITLLACGTTAPTAVDSETAKTESTETPEIVIFTDSVLEARVREAMNKPDGDITVTEAEAVTELDLSTDFTPDEQEEGTVITNLNGIECFTNLDSLSLHFQAVTDITPIANLTNLRSLGLGGNPIADLSPLSGMGNLKSLTLFNCQAEDYSPLENLISLDTLLLEYSTISDLTPVSGLENLRWLSLVGTQVNDVSPLSNLMNLKTLQLEGCPITDYSPLTKLYPNLEEADFSIVSSLRELGFNPISNAPQVESYKNNKIIVQVHHAAWGEQENPDNTNAVILCNNHGTENEIVTVYYPDSMVYLVFSNAKDFRYTFDVQNDSMNVEYGEERANALINEVYDEIDPYALMTPIKDFTDILTDTFGVSAETLYRLPREQEEEEENETASLADLGFVVNQENGSWIYEQHEPSYYSIEIGHPETGEQDYDIRFFTGINEYGLIIYYHNNDQSYSVNALDASVEDSYAVFDFYAKDDSTIDRELSGADSVEAYFQMVYDDPEIEDVYLYSVLLMRSYINETFGMSVDELSVLPME